MIDINHLRDLLEGGAEADIDEMRTEDSSVTLLRALPELLDELEASRAKLRYIEQVTKNPAVEGPRPLWELVSRLEDINHKSTPGPWEQHYGYNNGGCPTAFFKIPAHNGGAEVEMLAEDAASIVELRNMLPELLTVLHDLVSPEDTKKLLDSIKKRILP